MQRVKIATISKILYQENFTIQPEDINFANHLGNERILVYANIIRQNFLDFYKLSSVDKQLNKYCIIANHEINYKSEGFLHDEILATIGVTNITECSFDILTYFIKVANNQPLVQIRSGVVYFDHTNKKITELPKQYLDVFL